MLDGIISLMNQKRQPKSFCVPANFRVKLCWVRLWQLTISLSQSYQMRPATQISLLLLTLYFASLFYDVCKVVMHFRLWSNLIWRFVFTNRWLRGTVYYWTEKGIRCNGHIFLPVLGTLWYPKWMFIYTVFSTGGWLWNHTFGRTCSLHHKQAIE